MKPRLLLPVLQAVLSTSLSLPSAREQQAAEPQSKPNLLILLADDLGYADLGCQGSTDIPTPHIDSIAANGRRCTNGYVTGCVCSPTRGALLTARYQQRYGLNTLEGLTKAQGLVGDEETLAELLKPAGYVSGIFGKWHLGSEPDKLPEAQGFDDLCYGEPLSHAGTSLTIRRGAGAAIQREASADNITTVIGREVPAFIERNRARPWFAYVAFKAPHMPQQPPPGYVEKFAHIEDEQRRLYCAAVAAQDDTVGLILAALRESKQEERTLVVYLSDNGGLGLVSRPRGSPSGDSSGSLHPAPPSNAYNFPLRGAKGSLREGGIRVPFLIQWKGVLPAGKTYDRPITQMDIGATILAAAGMKEGLPKLDGVNILPYLTGQEMGDPHAALFWTYPGGQTAVRAGDWKLVRARGGRDAPQLFDLARDIGETKDLAAENPAKVHDLEQYFAAWLRDVENADGSLTEQGVDR